MKRQATNSHYLTFIRHCYLPEMPIYVERERERERAYPGNNIKKAKKDKTAIYVFPNPANDYTILSYSIEVSGTMQLVSQEGRVVRFENLKSGTNQFLLRTSGFEALLTLASNSNSASASARNLLSAYRIITYEPSIALPDTSLKSSFVVSKPKTKGKSSQAMLHVFPNPANEYVVIAYKLDNRGELTIVSQDGRIVHSQIINPGQNQVVVRVNYLTSGIYIARMVEGKKVHSTKFTVK